MPMPALATRLRRSLGFRSRLALAFLTLLLSAVAWDSFRDQPDRWPTRLVIAPPPKSYPLGFSPDGRTFLTTGVLGVVPWDVATGLPGKRWACTVSWFVTQGAWSPDGRTYAAVICGNPQYATIEVIDAATGRTRATITTRHPLVYHIQFVDGGKSLRVFLGDSAAIKEAATWDVATGQLISTRPISVSTLGIHWAFSPDGHWLATLNRLATVVHLRDMEADRPPISLADPSRSGLLGSGLGFSPDGQTLAVAREGGLVDLWDVAACKVTRTLAVHPPGYTADRLVFSPDGRTLASIAGEESGPALALFRIYSDLLRRLTGKGLVRRRENVLVDVAAGEKLGRYSSHHIPFFSRDGRSLATTGANADDSALLIRVRDLPTPPAAKGNHP